MAVRSLHKRFIFLGIIFLFLFSLAVAQNKTRKEYERERKALQEKLAQGKKVLQEIEGKQEATVGQLRVLQEQISARRSLINTLTSEVRLLAEEENEIGDIIIAMESDTARLKKEYAEMVFQSYKLNNEYNEVTYLLSAESFNQMAVRKEYLKQFTEARKTQVIKIKKVLASLNKQHAELEKRRKEKSALLNKLNAEKSTLDRMKRKQGNLIDQLQEKAAEHRKEIQKWKERQDELDKIIQKFIEDEMKKKNSPSSAMTMKERRGLELVSKNFEANKARLPWPVDRCTVSRKFGQHRDPLLGIVENNLGVGLTTQGGAQVKAVFDGKVAIVANIRGQNKMVMLKHGTYFTVYINLKEVQVRPGQDVKVGDVLGAVSSDKNGISELEFHVWKGNGAESEKLNPEQWLAK